MKVISLLSMKGGTSKTTTAVNLAVGLANKGFKTLLIDCDAQGNATGFFTKQRDTIAALKEVKDSEFDIKEKIERAVKANKAYETDIYDVLLRPDMVTSAIYPTDIPKLSLIPSQEHTLIRADKEITADIRQPQHNRLKKALRKVRGEYDYVILDNAPTSNAITINSLMVSDLVLIPVKPGSDEIEGLCATINDIAAISENYDTSIDYKVVFSMFHKSVSGALYRTLEKEEYEVLSDLLREHQTRTIIRYQDGAINRASINKNFIIQARHHAVNGQENSVISDYLDLVDEISEVK